MQLWRLPAVLVTTSTRYRTQFETVCFIGPLTQHSLVGYPDLLRIAYDEAPYRVDEFEFERLTPSYWYALIGKIAHTSSSQPVFEK